MLSDMKYWGKYFRISFLYGFKVQIVHYGFKTEIFSIQTVLEEML